MLAKINRIKKKKDFEVIFKNSKSLKNNLFILKVAKNNLGLNRFGFVVSLKISKKATVRNIAPNLFFPDLGVAHAPSERDELF